IGSERLVLADLPHPKMVARELAEEVGRPALVFDEELGELASLRAGEAGHAQQSCLAVLLRGATGEEPRLRLFDGGCPGDWCVLQVFTHWVVLTQLDQEWHIDCREREGASRGLRGGWGRGRSRLDGRLLHL